MQIIRFLLEINYLNQLRSLSFSLNERASQSWSGRSCRPSSAMCSESKWEGLDGIGRWRRALCAVSTRSCHLSFAGGVTRTWSSNKCKWTLILTCHILITGLWWYSWSIVGFAQDIQSLPISTSSVIFVFGRFQCCFFKFWFAGRLCGPWESKPWSDLFIVLLKNQVPEQPLFTSRQSWVCTD